MNTQSIWYIDSTLRDGEQAPGVSFSHREKITIAALLDVTGIDELEAGTPAIGAKEQNTIHTIVKQGFSFRTSSWCRALKADIDAARKCKTDGVNLSFPVSAIHQQSMGKSPQWVFENLFSTVRYARNYFEYVSVGAQDASRADFPFLQKFLSLCSELQVHRVRIADTVGCLNPFSTQLLFNKILDRFPGLNLEFHGHNDLGMATANTLAAITSGARAVSTTVNGLGERAGNASLDEVVMACRKTLQLKDKLNSQFFPYLAANVEMASGRTNADSKPITGKAALQHESGIHTRCLLNNPESYQIIGSEELGRQGTSIVFGKHSGTSAIVQLFEQKGITLENNNLEGLMQQIKLFSSMRKKAMEEEDLMELYYRLT